MPQPVHRGPRVRPPAPERVQFEVPAPPALDAPARLQAVQLLVPVLGSLSILVYGVMARTPVLLVTGGVVALASLASPILLHHVARRAQRGRQARRRERYRRHLAELAEAVTAAKERLVVRSAEAHPLPEEYGAWVGGDRLWERRPDDDDVVTVRLGTADLPSGLSVAVPNSTSADVEPDEELVGEVRALEAAAVLLPSAPLVLDLADAGVLAVAGDRAAALALARAAVLELAVTCAPDDLRILVATPEAELPAWTWAKWLPHTAADRHGGGIAGRLLTTRRAELEQHLQDLVAPRWRLLDERAWSPSAEAFPRLLVVVDRFHPLTELGLSSVLTRVVEQGGAVRVVVLAVLDDDHAAPSRTGALVTVTADGTGRLRRLTAAACQVAFTATDAGIETAEQVARALAPKVLVGSPGPGRREGGARLVDLLGPRTPAAAPAGEGGVPTGEPRPSAAELLRVPFGVDVDGSPVHLDLKESADGGYGPHGLVVGAVGSGKSELLRSLVCGLAATHPPEDVELAFADFKGGLTFSLLQQLPHCSGMITNLAEDLSLVDRMKAALTGELERRQRLLRAAGEDVHKIGQYRELRAAGADLAPLPYLVVVVDEFGELLEARPDVLETLLSIGRTGRSLGVHLVLASQRLESGRTRGLDSYLGYRICLRTFTADDSTSVLGSRVAADLPALPGHGYLRTAAGTTRFVAATVSQRRNHGVRRPVVRPFVVGHDSTRPLPSPRSVAGAAQAIPGDGEAETDLNVLVAAAARSGEHARRPPLWLPPLPDPRELAALTLTDERLRVEPLPPARGLPVPIGLVDRPRERRQPALLLDPGTLDGHLLVVGAPRSGKSTVLAGYAVQAARIHPASMLQFHVVDLGGGGLAPLAGLPNVASYADGRDGGAVRRIIAQLERTIDDQGRRLRRHGVSGLPAWRELVVAGAVDGPAHTILLLDNVAAFRERFPDLDISLGRLLADGPAAGVHGALTTTRWAELPPQRLEQISTRIELRLNDPMESMHGRVLASGVASGLPGRGLVVGGALVQVARPAQLDAVGSVDLARAVTAAADTARRRWPGCVAAPLRSLADLSAGDWSEAAQRCRAEEHLFLGVDETGLRPLPAPVGGLALLAYGDAGTGRSRLLARLVGDAAAMPEGRRPRVYALDYLGSVLDRCDSSMPVAAAYGPGEAADVVDALVDDLTRRQAALAAARRAMSPPGTAGTQPPIWFVADDYELVHASARPGLVADLAAFVPYASKLGLTMIVAQGANGSGARVDPLVRRILESHPWHLQFSVESRLELLLRGTRGTPLPPAQALLGRPGRPDSLLAVLPPSSVSASSPSRPSVAPTASVEAEAPNRRSFVRLVS